MKNVLQVKINMSRTEDRRPKTEAGTSPLSSVFRLRSSVFFLLFLSLNVLHETSSAQISQWRFFIGFTDKNNSPFSTSNPSAFLSARAIQRRTTQNISYKNDDLPVNPQYVDSIV